MSQQLNALDLAGSVNAPQAKISVQPLAFTSITTSLGVAPPPPRTTTEIVVADVCRHLEIEENHFYEMESSSTTFAQSQRLLVDSNERSAGIEPFPKTGSETYGETTFRSLAYMLSLVVRDRSDRAMQLTKFVDIGCGTGNVLYMASLLWPFKSVVGFEVNSSLTTTSVVDNLIHQCHGSVKVFNDDASQNLSWRDADIVFTHSICFTPTLMSAIVQATQTMSESSTFVCMQPCSERQYPWLELKHQVRLPTSYSAAFFYVYQIKQGNTTDTCAIGTFVDVD